MTLQDSARFIENYDFDLFILVFKFHLLQKSFNLQRIVCKPLAVLDESTMSSAYIRQDICKHSCLVALGCTGHQSILTTHLGTAKKK